MPEQAVQWPTANPGIKPNAQPPAPPHANPNAVEHAAIGEVRKQQGGKDMSQIDAPIVSMHPTSEPQGDQKAKIGEHRIIDNANFKLNHYLPEVGHVEFNYPFEDLVIGQGMFILVEENSTTDALMTKLYKQVDQYRKQASEIDRDENGDDIMIDLAINQKKRNEDGTVQLDGDKPRLGIKSGFTPKLVGPTFIVKAVVKGDQLAKNNEADGDGALVIRMS